VIDPAASASLDGASVTWVEVDASALAHNLRAVKSMLSPGVGLMAVVKANAYGHGAAAARVFQDAGASMLAVTSLQEALALRSAGVTAPVLLFCPLLPAQFPLAAGANLTLTISGAENATWLSEAAKTNPVDVHLKVDTGMGRLGSLPDDAARTTHLVRSLPGLRLKGIYTHLSTAMNRDLGLARSQVARFRDLLDQIESSGDRPPIAHCANSAAALQLPESHFDMVRIGTLLYGQYPAPFLSGRLSLQRTWRLLSRIVSVKEIPTGWTIGYGAEYRAPRPLRVAVVPVGYADGLAVEVAARSPRSFVERLTAAAKALRGSARPNVLIDGKRTAILGRIGMQMITIDVTGFPNAAPGAIVEIPCRRVTSNPTLPRVLVNEPSSE